MIPPPYATVEIHGPGSWTARIGWVDPVEGVEHPVVAVIYDEAQDPRTPSDPRFTRDDPMLVTWDEQGHVVDGSPAFPLASVPGAVELLDRLTLAPTPPAPAPDPAGELVKLLAAIHPDLPAAVGHAMAYVVDDEDGWPARVIVDPDMHEAAAKFVVIAKRLAAAKANVEPDNVDTDWLDDWRDEITPGFVPDWRSYVAQCEAENNDPDED